ncbi:MAG: hypothetical protein ACE5G3_12735, partial [Gammaproteobacteria bacterium]
QALWRQCTDHGFAVTRLEDRYDVDLAADLDRLTGDLSRDRRPARQALLRWLGTDRTVATARRRRAP